MTSIQKHTKADRITDDDLTIQTHRQKGKQTDRHTEGQIMTYRYRNIQRQTEQMMT